MIDTALQETINASDVHNITNNLYYYTLINNQLVFLTYNNGIFTNALNTALTYHANAISVQAFSINQNNLVPKSKSRIWCTLVTINVSVTYLFLFT